MANFELPYTNLLWVKNNQPVEGTDNSDSQVLANIDKIGRQKYDESTKSRVSLDDGYDLNPDGAVNGLAKQLLKNILALAESENSILTQLATINAKLETLAPKASPIFTGTPKAPTPTSGDSSTNIATTAFVSSAVSAISSWQVPDYSSTVLHSLTKSSSYTVPSDGYVAAQGSTTSSSVASILVNGTPVSSINTLHYISLFVGTTSDKQNICIPVKSGDVLSTTSNNTYYCTFYPLR